MNYQISNAEKIGIISYIAALLLSFFDIRFAAIPLVLFILLCFTAPFFYNLSFFLPIVSFGNTKKRSLSLTFDDGPDPNSTSEILRLLLKHNVKAAFFIVGNKAEKYPDLIQQILSQGHEIGNHSYSHDNLIMLKSSSALKKEIHSCQNVLKKLGILCFAFRPPVGIINPKLGSILSKSGLFAVNFRLRPGDGGNRWIKNLSNRVLKKIQPGDIIVLHDAVPAKKEQINYWIKEIDAIISGIKKKGFAIIPLSELIGRKVMIKL
ncbi:Polysaccharide deacetylase domain-containing protein [Desulfonema limicola]|uniref:Polysaccharide deacetylase domain-containing protein n=1 Tax=Desulfonema limicola TaxID=45656 RepID=A0A975GGN3_9BACT|nr:polysaccharide deacetylase family protein [Desulfonema limicola]QTA80520.1 Polysaccharide deacetylase domain-containing protein [Desulfonema limicola]